jgi:hypothetical protein
MKFDLLSHEEDTLEFYKKLISESDDVELKKQLLQHHFDYLTSLHAVEKEFRSTIMQFEKEMDKNDIEYQKLRNESRSMPRQQRVDS